MNNKIENIIKEEIDNFLIEAEDGDISINDEFNVSAHGLREINKVLEKVNKNLKTRNKTQLEIETVNTETKIFKKFNKYAGITIDIPYEVYTIKIVGDIPDIHDYEFVAKIEHTMAGNIINMNPSIPKENLPVEYRTFNQRCDICGTNRERNNTFILKKVETQELMVAGSTCLKKFLPLDAVKAMLNLGIQLETLRSSIVNIDLQDGDNELKLFGNSGGDGTGRQVEYISHKEILYYLCLAYLSNNKFFITKSKADETGQTATIWDATHLMDVSNNMVLVKPEVKQEVEETNRKYGNEAKHLSDKIMTWAKAFDFDEAMVKNPNFADYYNNLKVIINLPDMEQKHLGYFSSLVPMYVRENDPKKFIKKDLKQLSDYVGVQGEKIIDHEVKYIRSSSFDGPFGIGYIVVFEDMNHNALLWFTSSYNSVEKIKTHVETDKERKFKITGIVKQHKVNSFKGQDEKQTVLKNVKLNLGR